MVIRWQLIGFQWVAALPDPACHCAAKRRGNSGRPVARKCETKWPRNAVAKPIRFCLSIGNIAEIAAESLPFVALFLGGDFVQNVARKGLPLLLRK